MTIVDVKNTILTSLTEAIAPHYCCSCGVIGSLLCEHCKYDIINDRYERCVSCLAPSPSSDALCQKCSAAVPYTRAWCVGERSGALKHLIDLAKFHSTHHAAKVLGTLLDQTLPWLPTDTVVVAVPTIASHIRQRGYDHVALISKEFARQRKLSYSSCLHRNGHAVQHGATRSERMRQAREAFTCDVAKGRYLLIDDIYTTGATMYHAAKKLREAGADEVWIAPIARQPLEK